MPHTSSLSLNKLIVVVSLVRSALCFLERDSILLILLCGDASVVRARFLPLPPLSADQKLSLTILWLKRIKSYGVKTSG